MPSGPGVLLCVRDWIHSWKEQPSRMESWSHFLFLWVSSSVLVMGVSRRKWSSHCRSIQG
eukprot:1110298-Pelagomonas_calceolata.AAC.1